MEEVYGLRALLRMPWVVSDISMRWRLIGREMGQVSRSSLNVGRRWSLVIRVETWDSVKAQILEVRVWPQLQWKTFGRPTNNQSLPPGVHSWTRGSSRLPMERLNAFKSKANEFATSQRGKMDGAKNKGFKCCGNRLISSSVRR